MPVPMCKMLRDNRLGDMHAEDLSVIEHCLYGKTSRS